MQHFYEGVKSEKHHSSNKENIMKKLSFTDTRILEHNKTIRKQVKTRGKNVVRSKTKQQKRKERQHISKSTMGQ